MTKINANDTNNNHSATAASSCEMNPVADDSGMSMETAPTTPARSKDEVRTQRANALRAQIAAKVPAHNVGSNRELMGIDEASIDAELELDPSLGNVLKLTAKQTAYDVWDGLTAGFVSKHDKLFEDRQDGKIKGSDYVAGTIGEASESILVVAASGGAAKAGVAASGTMKLGLVGTGAVSGAAAGATGNTVKQASEKMLGQRDNFDLVEVGTSTATGVLLGAAAGKIGNQLQAARGAEALAPGSARALRVGAAQGRKVADAYIKKASE